MTHPIERIIEERDEALARVAELERGRDAAIKEIGVWSRKAGLVEAKRDQLAKVVEAVRGAAGPIAIYADKPVNECTPEEALMRAVARRIRAQLPAPDTSQSPDVGRAATKLPKVSDGGE